MESSIMNHSGEISTNGESLGFKIQGVVNK